MNTPEIMHKPIKKINPDLYTFSCWGGIGIVFLAVIGLEDPSLSREGEGTFLLMLFAGIAAAIYAGIYFLISLYRCWSILKGPTARTTPGKAVGFLFIPFFNLYWMFVVVGGLAKDANAFLESKNAGKTIKINVELSTAACITYIISFIPHYYVAIPAGIVSLVLLNILIYQWAAFLDFAVKELEARKAIKNQTASRTKLEHKQGKEWWR